MRITAMWNSGQLLTTLGLSGFAPPGDGTMALLLLALLTQVANVFVLAYLAGQSIETGAPPPSAVVVTPGWLPLFTLIFATIIGLLSGLYPALSAATLPPIKALKYE